MSRLPVATALLLTACGNITPQINQQPSVSDLVPNWQTPPDGSSASPNVLPSQDPLATKISDLEHLLEAGVELNPGLKADLSAWQSDLAIIDQVEGYPDPVVAIGGFLSPLETRNGPVQGRIGIRQRLPWISELDADIDAATARASAAYCRYLDQTLALREKLEVAWWELAFAIEAQSLITQNLEFVNATEQSLHSKLEVGKASYGDLIRVEVERAKLEELLLSYQDQAETIHSEISNLLGIQEELLELPEPGLFDSNPSLEAEDLPQQPSTDHPQLLALDYLRAASLADLERAKTAGKPEISLGLEWTLIGDGPASAPDSGEDAIAASVQFSLPLHQKRYAGARSQAQQQITRYTVSRRDTQLVLRTGMVRSGFQYREALRRRHLFKEQLGPKTESSFEAALSGLEAGTTRFETLLDTLRLLLDFQLSAARAEADKNLALAKFERQFGNSDFEAPASQADLNPPTPQDQ